MEDPKSPCQRQARLEQLTELAEFIESHYGNDLAHIKGQLLEIIYILHYIDPGCFDQKEIREKYFFAVQAVGSLKTLTLVGLIGLEPYRFDSDSGY